MFILDSPNAVLKLSENEIKVSCTCIWHCPALLLWGRAYI